MRTCCLKLDVRCTSLSISLGVGHLLFLCAQPGEIRLRKHASGCMYLTRDARIIGEHRGFLEAGKYISMTFSPHSAFSLSYEPFNTSTMKLNSSLTIVSALAVAVAAQKSYNDTLPPVGQTEIEDTITTEALSAKALELQEAAYSTPNRNRVMGSEGHNNTIQWLKSYLDSMSDYYSYEIQPFIGLYSHGNASLSVNGEDQGAEIFEYSPGAEIEAEIVAVDNLGCEAADYPDAVADAIALISRGECDFGLKSALAGAAGAQAAIIYNNEPGPIGSGTLGPPPRPEGEYVPTVGIAQENGTAILDLLEGGDAITGVLEVVSEIYNLTT